jgi:predicted Zn-dependent protease
MAVYFDGTSSRRRLTTLLFQDRLGIHDGDRKLADWVYADIRRADGAPGILRLHCVAAPPLARLEIRDAATQAVLLTRCPALDQGPAGGRGVVPIVAWSLAAVASIVGIALVGLPLAADRLAPLVPLSLERRFGDVAERQIKAMYPGDVCQNPQGLAALRHLVGEVAVAAEISVPDDPVVVPSPVANAFALPGGRVIILSGMLAKADNADELAGVLGHEFGHLKHRDSMRGLIHSGGLAFLAGMLFGDISGGGTIVVASRTLIAASHSREMEDSADTFAIATMHRLGRPPRALADLLTRITGSHDDMNTSLLASHPLTRDRLERMRADDRANSPPLLTSDQWRALKTICEPVPKA